MEAQLHRTHGRDHEDPLHSSGTSDVQVKEERGGETRSAMKKVKEKVDKLKATIKHHGHHGALELKDEAETLNNSELVRCGLVEPTVMGTPVLAEDLYATHSDILDPPVRSFAQWQDEEKRHSPPPLSTAYETTRHTDLPHHSGDVNKEQLKGGIGKPTGSLEKQRADAPPPPPPPSTGYESLTNQQHNIYGEDINKKPLERDGAPLSTGYQTHPPDPSYVSYDITYDPVVNREQLKVGIGNPTVEEEGGYVAPLPPLTEIYETDRCQVISPDAYGDNPLYREERVDTVILTGMEEENIPDTGGNEVVVTEVRPQYIGGN